MVQTRPLPRIFTPHVHSPFPDLVSYPLPRFVSVALGSNRVVCKNAFALTEDLDSVVLQATRPQDKQAFEALLRPLLTQSQ